MKHLLFTILIVITATTISARDRLYINGFTINAGESKIIEVELKNDTAYCGLQTDIILPEGLTIDTEQDDYIIDLTSRKAKDHVVSTNLLANGSIRVFVSSQNSRTFSGNSGAIMTLDLTASSTFEKGNIVLHNSVLVEEDGTRHLLNDETTKVNDDGLLGDVNGDGAVDVKDVTALISACLGKEPAGFVKANADLNGDGDVDVKDVTALINLILK